MSSTEPHAPALSAGSPGTVLVTGGTGFVGRHLVHELLTAGHPVIVLSRDARKVRARWGDAVQGLESLQALPDETALEAVVNLAGAPVLGPPWTAARRRELLGSRLRVSAAVRALLGRLKQPPQVLVSASAVGFYGRSQGVLDESAPPQPGQFQSDLCAAIEQEAQRAEALGLRVVRLRLGIVLGRDGGAYPGLALSARLGLGARLGSGRQPVPWVHLDDAVGLIRHALACTSLQGAVNAVAPDGVAQAEFTEALAQSWGRKARLWVPGSILRFGLGEMSELLLEGQQVQPRAALDSGYVFRQPSLRPALQALAQGEG